MLELRAMAPPVTLSTACIPSITQLHGVFRRVATVFLGLRAPLNICGSDGHDQNECVEVSWFKTAFGGYC